MNISFVIVGDIMTKQRPRATVIGKHAHIYTPKTTQVYENYVKECYLNEAKLKVNNALMEKESFDDLPLIVKITAYFKAPKKYAKLKDSVGLLACMKHKDLDNIAKIICDSLNGVAYNDDKQIVKLYVEKKWSNVCEKVQVDIEDYADIYLTPKEVKVHQDWIDKLEWDARNKGK